MSGFYDQVTAVLKKHGFVLVRQGKGSHEIWGKGKVRVSVPVNCRSRHTANSVLKDAGIKHKI